MKKTYEEWLEENEDELRIADAESGADRELDYDEEALREKQYFEYLKGIDILSHESKEKFN